MIWNALNAVTDLTHLLALKRDLGITITHSQKENRQNKSVRSVSPCLPSSKQVFVPTMLTTLYPFLWPLASRVRRRIPANHEA